MCSSDGVHSRSTSERPSGNTIHQAHNPRGHSLHMTLSINLSALLRVSLATDPTQTRSSNSVGSPVEVKQVFTKQMTFVSVCLGRYQVATTKLWLNNTNTVSLNNDMQLSCYSEPSKPLSKTNLGEAQTRARKQLAGTGKVMKFYETTTKVTHTASSFLSSFWRAF